MFARLARSVASRLLSVRPGRVGTPLNAPLSASLMRCPWYEPKKNILFFYDGTAHGCAENVAVERRGAEKNGFGARNVERHRNRCSGSTRKLARGDGLCRTWSWFRCARRWPSPWMRRTWRLRRAPLDGFDRWRGQGLPDRVEYGAVGLNLAADPKDFARVQREAAVGNLACRISVKDIVGIHTVEGE